MIYHTDVDLKLFRHWFTDRSTISELFFTGDALRQCFMLEDTARAPEIKLPKITCIPAMDYFIKITHSPHFDRLLPLIYNEEHYIDQEGVHHYYIVRFQNVIFEGVRIHAGNKPPDTDACQLTGRIRKEDEVQESKLAFDALYDRIFKMIGTTGTLKYRIINAQQK